MNLCAKRQQDSLSLLSLGGPGRVKILPTPSKIGKRTHVCSTHIACRAPVWNRWSPEALPQHNFGTLEPLTSGKGTLDCLVDGV